MSQMYTILKFYNDKNEAHCQMSMRIYIQVYTEKYCVHNVKKKGGTRA